ncbi:MAG: hypothetical protein ACM3NH_00885 [Candidatus Saccharibacteria bacterium]
MDNKDEKTQPERSEIMRPPRRQRRVDYLVAVIVNIILLFVFNGLLRWHVPFLTPAFTGSLWILNVSLSATIVANLVFLIVYREPWFKALFRIVIGALGLTFLYLLYLTFPFDFTGHSAHWPFAVRTALILGMAGVMIGVIVDLFKLFFNKD